MNEVLIFIGIYLGSMILLWINLYLAKLLGQEADEEATQIIINISFIPFIGSVISATLAVFVIVMTIQAYSKWLAKKVT